MELVAGAIR
jgi:hypothetical protein